MQQENSKTQGAFMAQKNSLTLFAFRNTHLVHYIDNAKNASHKNLKIQTKN